MDKPEPLNDSTTKSMKSNKRKDTSPELIVRKALREAGYPGYRLQWDVPGRPDIAYPGKKVAIFVNGCFWHRCPKCDYDLPKHNSEYWMEKFRKNVERDKRNYENLESIDWTIIILWECEINQNLEEITDKIIKVLNDNIR